MEDYGGYAPSKIPFLSPPGKRILSRTEAMGREHGQTKLSLAMKDLIERGLVFCYEDYEGNIRIGLTTDGLAIGSLLDGGQPIRGD